MDCLECGRPFGCVFVDYTINGMVERWKCEPCGVSVVII